MENIYASEASTYRRFVTYEEDRDDAEFLKSLYPSQLIDLQLAVEEKCNELEYEGSIMYDQYPDKVRVCKVADAIYQEMKEYDRNLVEVMVINEMLRRRIRHRNCRVRGFC